MLPKLTTIGATAFKGCEALTKTTLSEMVKEIGKQAFLNCKGLKTITIKTTILLTKQTTTEIAIVDEQSIRNKIYVVRGVEVKFDFELAEIYMGILSINRSNAMKIVSMRTFAFS